MQNKTEPVRKQYNVIRVSLVLYVVAQGKIVDMLLKQMSH
jgi:hypothetical protein